MRFIKHENTLINLAQVRTIQLNNLINEILVIFSENQSIRLCFNTKEEKEEYWNALSTFFYPEKKSI